MLNEASEFLPLGGIVQLRGLPLPQATLWVQQLMSKELLHLDLLPCQNLSQFCQSQDGWTLSLSSATSATPEMLVGSVLFIFTTKLEPQRT